MGFPFLKGLDILPPGGERGPLSLIGSCVIKERTEQDTKRGWREDESPKNNVLGDCGLGRARSAGNPGARAGTSSGRGSEHVSIVRQASAPP